MRRGEVVGVSGCAVHRSGASYLVLASAGRAGRTWAVADIPVAEGDTGRLAAAVEVGRSHGSGFDHRAAGEADRRRRTIESHLVGSVHAKRCVQGQMPGQKGQPGQEVQDGIAAART